MRASLRTLRRLERLVGDEQPAFSLEDRLRQHRLMALLREHADGTPQPRLPDELTPSEREHAEAVLAVWEREDATFLDRYPEYRDVVQGL
jgi:hypothetical protein